MSRRCFSCFVIMKILILPAVFYFTWWVMWQKAGTDSADVSANLWICLEVLGEQISAELFSLYESSVQERHIFQLHKGSFSARWTRIPHRFIQCLHIKIPKILNIWEAGMSGVGKSNWVNTLPTDAMAPCVITSWATMLFVLSYRLAFVHEVMPFRQCTHCDVSDMDSH